MIYIFLGGRVLKLVKSGINITDSTNLVEVTANIRLAVVDFCITPSTRLAAHCVAAGLLIEIAATNPNPIMVGSAINLVSEIYEKC